MERPTAEGVRTESDARLQEVQEITAWAYSHNWASVVLPPRAEGAHKGVLVVRPGRMAGVMKFLLEFEETGSDSGP